MRVIGNRAIREFGVKYSDAIASLNLWKRLTKAATWNNTADVRNTFGDADFVGEHVVFNIGHNRYRLIAYISFRGAKVFIRHILTHKNYDKDRWK